MSVQKIKKIRISEAEYNEIKSQVLSRILSFSQPSAVHVIGSMVGRAICPESDFDAVLVFEDEGKIRAAQKKLSPLPPLPIKYPVKYVFMHNERFKKMKNVGGISFEAFHHGEKVHG